ncbi:MAG TPA: hypothetical protein ENI23_12525 [bacterium]|nr:hypothetical protein [bacterium]
MLKNIKKATKKNWRLSLIALVPLGVFLNFLLIVGVIWGIASLYQYFNNPSEDLIFPIEETTEPAVESVIEEELSEEENEQETKEVLDYKSPIEAKDLPTREYIPNTLNLYDLIYEFEGEIYISNLYGTNQAKITDTDGEIIRYLVSPTGDKMVYTISEKDSYSSYPDAPSTFTTTMFLLDLITGINREIASPIYLDLDHYDEKASIEFYAEWGRYNLSPLSFNESGTELLYSRDGIHSYNISNRKTKKIYSSNYGYESGMWNGNYLLLYSVPYEGLAGTVFQFSNDKLQRINSDNANFYSHAGGEVAEGFIEKNKLLVTNHYQKEDRVEVYDLENDTSQPIYIPPSEYTIGWVYLLNGEIYSLNQDTMSGRNLMGLFKIKHGSMEVFSDLLEIPEEYFISEITLDKTSSQLIMLGSEPNKGNDDTLISIISYNLKTKEIDVIYKAYTETYLNHANFIPFVYWIT